MEIDVIGWEGYLRLVDNSERIKGKIKQLEQKRDHRTDSYTKRKKQITREEILNSHSHRIFWWDRSTVSTISKKLLYEAGDIPPSDRDMFD